MSWLYVEFLCETHGRFENLADAEDQKQQERECPWCGVLAGRVISAPSAVTIVPGNSDFAQRQTERLDKRHFDYVGGKGKDDLIDQRKAAIARVTKQAERAANDPD